MLAAHAPPYNRRSKFPQRWWWVVLTDEAFPRFSVVRAPRHDRAVGPFRSRADAADTAALLARFTGVRTCTKRLARSALHGPACPQHEVSPCPAARDVTATQYAPAAARAAALIDGLDNTALAAAVHQVTALAERRRYESAARLRDHTVAAVEVLWRGQRLRALAALPELVAAAPDGDGRLAARRHPTRPARRGRHRPPRRAADAGGRRHPGRGAGDPAAPAPLGGALVEETALIARWLAAPGVRIVSASDGADDAGGPRRCGRRGLGRVGGVGALRAGGRRTSRHEPRLRPADRTAPIARAAVRPRRCRSRRRHGRARPPTPAAIRRGWIARHGRRSRPRR